jgi:hypothetical protein
MLKKIRNNFPSIKIVSFLFLGLFLLFYQIKAEEETFIEITQSTQWSGEIEIDKNVRVKSGAMLSISPGTTIKFNRGDGQAPPSIFIEKGGFLLAEGNEREKIKFTSDQQESCYSLIFDGNNDGEFYSGFMRYVEISKAGGFCEDENHQVLNFFIPKVFAQENLDNNYYPILHKNGMLLIENSEFKNNNNVDIFIKNQNVDPDNFVSKNNHLVSVINSNFSNNQEDIALAADFVCEENCEQLIFLKNNWYGKATGPHWIKQSWQYYQDHEDIFNDIIYGQKVIGPMIDNLDFRTKSLIADPLIFIPGIMGSEKEMIGSDLVLDPILHTYDDLIESLENNGYEKNKNLFPFPYDWRKSNELTAVQLAEKIKEIEDEFWSVRIDITSHSMGGLAARKYLQEAESLYNIDQFITLGTPHKGAPEAYLKWEAGAGFFGLQGFIAKYHFTQEAEHEGYDDLHQYIQEQVLSIKELLPDYDYLFDIEDNQLREYPDDYPRNTFLENLNIPEKLEKLNKIRTYNIAGKTEENNTLEKIRVVDNTDNNKWEHGFPENFDDKLTDRGLELGLGDETVPFGSASAVNFYQNIELDSSHSELPTKAQCEIFQILSGEKVCVYDEDFNIPNILLFNVFSPIDMQIVLEDGRKIGTDPESGEVVNEIEGAYYTGNDTENEFITIPNYSDGKYQILTSGTGDGDFRIEAHSVEVDEQGLVQEDKIEEIQGLATTGESQSFEIQVGEVTEEEEQDDEDSQGDEGEDDSEESEDGEDEEEDEKDDKNNNGRALGHIKQQEKKQEIAENKEQKKQKIEDKKLAQKEAKKNGSLPSQGQAGKTKVAGKSVQKSNPWIIAGMVLVGLIGIFLTWTIGKKDNFIKKYFK